MGSLSPHDYFHGVLERHWRNDEVGAIARNSRNTRAFAHFATQGVVRQELHGVVGHLLDVTYRAEKSIFAIVDDFG